MDSPPTRDHAQKTTLKNLIKTLFSVCSRAETDIVTIGLCRRPGDGCDDLFEGNVRDIFLCTDMHNEE